MPYVLPPPFYTLPTQLPCSGISQPSVLNYLMTPAWLQRKSYSPLHTMRKVYTQGDCCGWSGMAQLEHCWESD